MEDSIICRKRALSYFLFPALLLFGIFFVVSAGAAPSPDLWSRWQTHAPGSAVTVDHSPWNRFLGKYLVTQHPSGINRFRYGDVSPADRKNLAEYLDRLQQTEVSNLDRGEQLAYWINLYNALTVQIVLDHYPVRSIRDIDISPGWFTNGPWDAKLLTIEGESVSLNDIEHRILRPIFQDNRIHYAVNCASLGCPNLQPAAFSPVNTEGLLEAGAREYINSPRGARIEKGRLHVSSIYKWFQVDFGASEEGVIKHLLKYARDGLAVFLKTYDKGLIDDYDWRLNDAE